MRKLVVGVVVAVLAAGVVVKTAQSHPGIGYWDFFSVNLTPNGVYWNQVNGGNGALGDPLLSPDPAGNAVIDPATPLGGVAWGFGGADFGTGSLESNAGAYSIQLVGASDYYLSVVLDTKTLLYVDTSYVSWGTISDIVVTPGTPGNWGAPIALNSWVISPYDPDNGTIVVGGLASSVTVASFDFGSPESGTQPQGIWGAAHALPSAPGYRVDFLTNVSTWDSYNLGGVEPVPEPSLLLLSAAGLGALMALRRRK